jgi:hypothetical protein
MMRHRWWLAPVALLAGCSGGPAVAIVDDPARLRAQAEAALARYDRAVAAAGSGPVRVIPPSWDPHDPPGGTAISAATTTAGGRQLTVSFTGAPGPASRPCGVDYSGVAVESSRAVVVYLIEKHHAAAADCPAIGASRTAVVDLAGPLGERAVLEVQQGRPVALTVTS